VHRFGHPRELGAVAGRSLGVGPWREVTPTAVARFARATGDAQWIHLDADRAAAGPFGAPVAHGFLTLSMLPALISEIVEVGGVDWVVNKGLGRVRFGAPVPVGGRVRLALRLAGLRPRPRAFWEAEFAATVEVDGCADPACRADLTLLYRAIH